VRLSKSEFYPINREGWVEFTTALDHGNLTIGQVLEAAQDQNIAVFDLNGLHGTQHRFPDLFTNEGVHGIVVIACLGLQNGVVASRFLGQTPGALEPEVVLYLAEGGAENPAPKAIDMGHLKLRKGFDHLQDRLLG